MIAALRLQAVFYKWIVFGSGYGDSGSVVPRRLVALDFITPQEYRMPLSHGSEIFSIWEPSCLALSRLQGLHTSETLMRKETGEEDAVMI